MLLLFPFMCFTKLIIMRSLNVLCPLSGWCLTLALLSAIVVRAVCQDPASADVLGSTMTLDQLKSTGKSLDEELLLVTTAAAEPVPTFKYRFYPSSGELKPDSAEVHLSVRHAVLCTASGSDVQEMDRISNGVWE